MDSFSNDDEESKFFDAPEHIAQESDLVADSPCLNNWEYDVWINAPQSVPERRKRFFRWMRLSLDGENFVGKCDNRDSGGFIGDVDRIMEDTGAVLRTSSIEDEFPSSCSSVSSWNSGDLDSSRAADLCGYRNVKGNLNHEDECNVDGKMENQRLRNIRVAGSDHLRSSDEFENVSQLSLSDQHFQLREIEVDDNSPRALHNLKDRLFSRLRSMTCMVRGNVKDDNVVSDGFSQSQSTRIKRVGVRHCCRRLKELSALFTGQDIQAHDGSILTMKFSQDGQYLASAGEDKIVKVWQVVEDERSDTIDIPDADPSCVYFSVNHLSELGPLMVEKDKSNKFKSLRRTRDSACIIFPPKVCRILDKPLHVFQGHSGEILDLSWSKNNRLLSSSVDKTVRLWKVGLDQCIKVFSHSDYVTCIQFNPVNDDNFISGSIDGKVRIWAINNCQVVDWTQTKDIITAVCYRPDGQSGIIGSITGTCRFFSLSDNHFQLDSQMCLTSKKKSPCKRITGFQFLPQDPSKVLVACTDSQIRIIDGMHVIGKYKGLRNAGNQISASFTADGKHIISAAEDSNVYVWNYIDSGDSAFPQSKAIRSFECFRSDASVAIPWSGLKTRKSEDGRTPEKLHENSISSLPFSSTTCFSLSQELFLESGCNGSATWPEEKLPTPNPQAAKSPIGRSHYKLFKNSCQSSSNSHAWGLVIVTAGRDGRIRLFHNYGLPISL